MTLKSCYKSLVLFVFCLVCACTSGVKPSETTEPTTAMVRMGVSGKVTFSSGKPASGAYVYAYRNRKSHLRGPADFEARVDLDGRYFLDMVEGDYYLVTRMRQSGADAGPPRAGDGWALPERNPVKVQSNLLTTADFVLHGVSQPMLMREGTLTGGDTGFTGLLTNADGGPLPGAFVIAYPDNNYQRMPEATSPAVGDDGRFDLYVKRSGQWCLAARTRTRGQPTTGELYGLLGGGKPGCRTINKGEFIDVGTITLTPYK